MKPAPRHFVTVTEVCLQSAYAPGVRYDDASKSLDVIARVYDGTSEADREIPAT
jgi:hypothetical protein